MWSNVCFFIKVQAHFCLIFLAVCCWANLIQFNSIFESTHWVWSSKLLQEKNLSAQSDNSTLSLGEWDREWEGRSERESFQMVIAWFLNSTGIPTRKTVFFGKRWASLSLFSLSLTLWRTHTALMQPPRALSLVSKLKRLLRHKHKNTLCKKGVKRVTEFQKGKEVWP